MARQRRSPFSGRVTSTASAHVNRGSSYGYLKLPKDVSVFNPEPRSTVLLDFIPYLVTDENHPDKEYGVEIGTQWWNRPFSIHRDVGGEKVVCLTSVGKRCPICEHRKKRAKEGAGKDELDEMKTSRRMLYFVRPKDSKKFDDKLHVWDMSFKLFHETLAEDLENGDVHEEFPDLEEGYTLEVRFKSSRIGNGKPFAEASKIKEVERDEQYSDDYLNKVPSLDDILHIRSYAELERLFHDIDDADVDTSGDDLPFDKDDDEPVKRPTKETRSDSPQRRKTAEYKEEEKPAEEEPPKVQRGVSRSKPEKEEPKSECPFGHVWGKDNNTKDDCDVCDKWDPCRDAYDEM